MFHLKSSGNTKNMREHMGQNRVTKMIKIKELVIIIHGIVSIFLSQHLCYEKLFLLFDRCILF